MSETKRRYLADIFGKSAEFVISILLVGQLVTGRLTLRTMLGAGLMTCALVVIGTWLIPDHFGQKE